jgi:hypothetical protein
MIHASSDQAEKPFRIVAIYDSALTSAEVARASAIVLRELGEDVSVDRSSWNLKSLRSADICDFAASAAARADLIVIAIGCSEPNEDLQEWVTRWEKKRQLSGGLLALIPTREDGPVHHLENYFYETAVTANMDFLCGGASRY